jgi:hypothetical protein
MSAFAREDKEGHEPVDDELAGSRTVRQEWASRRWADTSMRQDPA